MGIPKSPPDTIAEPAAVPAISADVAVIGGGVIGHGIAWEATRSGRSVVLIDDAPGSGASWAAAGMLAPVSELHYQEEELLGLMLDASERWPQFAEDLTRMSGRGSGYLATPTLTIGADAADRRALMDLRGVQQANGLAVEPLTVREARRREPLLSPAIACALDTPADHQVDPRRLVGCFRAALANHLRAGSGVAGTAVAGAPDGFAVADRAVALEWADGAVAGVRLAGGGLVLAGETVVANGMAAGSLNNLPRGLRLPLRPVHGDILRLSVPQHLQPLLTSTVRGLVRGVPVYLVPREDGTVVIGATQRRTPWLGPALRSEPCRRVPDPVQCPPVQDRPAQHRPAQCPLAACTSCFATPRCWCLRSQSWSCWNARPGPARPPRTMPRCWAGCPWTGEMAVQRMSAGSSWPQDSSATEYFSPRPRPPSAAT